MIITAAWPGATDRRLDGDILIGDPPGGGSHGDIVDQDTLCLPDVDDPARCRIVLVVGRPRIRRWVDDLDVADDDPAVGLLVLGEVLAQRIRCRPDPATVGGGTYLMAGEKGGTMTVPPWGSESRQAWNASPECSMPVGSAPKSVTTAVLALAAAGSAGIIAAPAPSPAMARSRRRFSSRCAFDIVVIPFRSGELPGRVGDSIRS